MPTSIQKPDRQLPLPLDAMERRTRTLYWRPVGRMLPGHAEADREALQKYKPQRRLTRGV